jgi:hypothetical protein
VPPTPPIEPTPPAIPKVTVEDMKKDIKERAKKLKEYEEERLKFWGVKDEILIPPSNITISYMEPSDYEKWGFFDFESIIPGLEFEDLQQLYDHVNLSERTTYQEKKDIRALITERMNEIRVNRL